MPRAATGPNVERAVLKRGGRSLFESRSSPAPYPMKKSLGIIIGLLTLLSVARADSVTLGSSVVLSGTFFTDDDAWAPGLPAAPNDIVDGIYQPTNQQWNINSIWWNGGTHPENAILINLFGTAEITGFTVQADDNDSYRIEYWGLDSAWHTAWDVWPVFTYGLDSRSIILASSITTNLLRVTATGGDNYYAVSEVEAFGTAIPDEGVAGLMLAGALGLLVAARRLRR
jgi:hypothetical protein